MLEMFTKLVRDRVSCREFLGTPVSEKVIENLLDAARHAPSGYNLQPVHFIAVKEDSIKKKLFFACLKQPQVIEAQYVIVFAGDRNVAKNNAEAVLHQEMKTGCFTEEKAARFRGYLKLGFSGIWKRYIAPLIRMRTVLPMLPIENMDAWLAKHVGFSSMSFMLAAQAAGLSTCPMDAFDEKKVKKILGLNHSWYVPLIVVVGYGVRPKIKTSRLPLSTLVSWR